MSFKKHIITEKIYNDVLWHESPVCMYKVCTCIHQSKISMLCTSRLHCFTCIRPAVIWIVKNFLFNLCFIPHRELLLCKCIHSFFVMCVSFKSILNKAFTLHMGREGFYRIRLSGDVFLCFVFVCFTCVHEYLNLVVVLLVAVIVVSGENGCSSLLSKGLLYDDVLIWERLPHQCSPHPPAHTHTHTHLRAPYH